MSIHWWRCDTNDLKRIANSQRMRLSGPCETGESELDVEMKRWKHFFETFATALEVY